MHVNVQSFAESTWERLTLCKYIILRVSLPGRAFYRNYLSTIGKTSRSRQELVQVRVCILTVYCFRYALHP